MRQTYDMMKGNMYTFLQSRYQKGTISLIGSQPSVGRLKWMMDNAIYAQHRNRSPLFLSFDIPALSLKERCISLYGSMSHVQSFASSLPVHDMQFPTFPEIEKWLIDYQSIHEVDEIYLDSMDLIVNESTNRSYGKEDAHKLIKKFASLATKLNVALIIGKQLPHDLDYKESSRPTLSDFGFRKEAWSLVENIITLYRDELYNPLTEKENIIESIVLKSTLHQGIPFVVESPFIHEFPF